jgi:dipeptidyl-peptidase-4
VLLDAASPYEGRKVPEVTVGTLKAADGETDLYYRLVKPTDFDPTRRYPAVVYLYNGPHAQMIVEGLLYDARGWDLYMANRGYVVFTIDGRGSERRGLKFEQAIWHHLGYEEGRDQMCGVRYLLDQPFVDSTRVGIHGWSYGGFMTTYMMLNYPETFKVGVAGGPVLDWSRYEVMYGERYMGTPQSNPDGYRANCLIQQAGRLQGHLLLIHDDQDGTVVPQHSMQFLKTAVKEGTFPDYFMYPGHEHNVRGVDRVHLLEKIARYFDDYLKPPSAE